MSTPSNDPGNFWGNGSGNNSSSPDSTSGEGFWKKVEDQKRNERDAAARQSGTPAPRKRSRWGRVLLFGGGGVIVMLILLVALAPTIAGVFAPGIIASRAGKQINGAVTVDSASFGWGGPQVIQGIKVTDANKTEVVRVKTIEVSAGLMGLIFGNLDVGTITITSPRAEIVKAADGTTNLERLMPRPAPGAAAPSPSPQASQPASLPESLKAKLVIKNLEASYSDATAPGADGKPLAVALDNFNAAAQIGAGDPLKIEAQGDAGQVTANSAAAKTGSITINAVIKQWTNKQGKITFDKADVDAKVDVKSLPLGLVDAFIGSALNGGSLRQGLGPTADLTIVAKGDMTSGDAQLNFTTPNGTAKGSLKLAQNTLTTVTPLVIELKGSAIAGLAPAFRKSLDSQTQAKIDTLPDAKVTIDQLKFSLPNQPGAINLKGSGARIVLDLGEVKGSVALSEGQPQQPFRIAPLSATIAATDLSQPVRITGATTADIGGQPAGNLNIDVTASDLLDKSGVLVKGMPGSVNGSVVLKGMATAIAQPFVQAFKLDLPSDVGPSLDAELKIATQPATTGTPPADVDINVRSQFLNVVGSVRFDKNTLTTRGDGVRVDAARIATIAGRFMTPDSGFAVASSRPDAKGLSLSVKNLDAPMNSVGKPDMKAAAADIDLRLDGVSLVPMIDKKPGPALDVQTLTVTTKIAKGGNLQGSIDGKLWHESVPFTTTGSFDIASLLVNDAAGNPGVAMGAMRPKGTIELKDVPVGIARLAPSQPAADGAKPLDLAALLNGVMGPNFTVTVNAASVEGTAGAYDANVKLTSQRVKADIIGRGSEKQIDLRTFGASADVTPETVTGLMHTFAPTVTGIPQLAAPSKLTLILDPISVPLDSNRKPDFSRVGPASLKVNLPGRTIIQGLTAKNADGTTRDLGQFGVQDFELTANAPVAAMFGPALPNQRAVTARLKGTLLGASAAPIGILDGDLSTELSDKQLAGALNAKINITQIDVAAIERIIGQQGKISGAIGNTASVRVDGTVSPPANAAKGAAFDMAAATMNVQASIDAPKLKSDGPLAATISPDAIRLSKSSKMTLEVDPVWANTFLTPPPAAAGQKPAVQTLTLKEITPISINLEKLTLPRAQPGKPSTAPLEAALSLAISKIGLQANDGSPMSLGGTSISINSDVPGPRGTPVNFRMGVDSAKIADKPAVTGLNLKGTVDGLIGPDGGVNAQAATLSSNGDLPQIPTALIDALSTKDGTIPDALGPVASAKFTIERFPLGNQPPAGAPAVVDFNATSERANASLRGTIRDNMYVSEKPFKASITEVTQALAERYIKGLPLFGSFEKSKKDQPATLEVTNITAALNNDLTKLNADVMFDPGEANFGTSGTFAELLKTINVKDAGTVGRRLEPINVQVRKGIATYQRWKVPLGQFTVETEGTVDLVNKQLDVVTYIPFGALSDKAAGQLNLGAGSAITKILPGAIESLTQIPFRTKGPMGAAKTNVDPEMLAKNLGKTLNPERIIKDNLGDLLKKSVPKEPKPPPK
ncbi:MAG: hypothetical protein JSR77_06055 [Planctomycetes bacterium]|nr:hypothetical protein [Planctomycetota bacterium]